MLSIRFGDPSHRQLRVPPHAVLSIKAVKEILDTDNLKLSSIPHEDAVAKQPVGASQGMSSGADPKDEPTVRGTKDQSISSAAMPTAAQERSVALARPTSTRLTETVQLGRTHGLRPADVELNIAELKRHAAFLGSTGSGKTTAATMVVEQLLARRIPAGDPSLGKRTVSLI
jgi:ABC-type glutathione transport system ATPase component